MCVFWCPTRKNIVYNSVCCFCVCICVDKYNISARNLIRIPVHLLGIYRIRTYGVRIYKHGCVFIRCVKIHIVQVICVHVQRLILRVFVCVCFRFLNVCSYACVGEQTRLLKLLYESCATHYVCIGPICNVSWQCVGVCTEAEREREKERGEGERLYKTLCLRVPTSIGSPSHNLIIKHLILIGNYPWR